jgi:hypothetical protein
MSTSTVSTNGVHHPTDEAIDVLYSFWPGTTPTPQPLPEAAFSLTLGTHLRRDTVIPQWLQASKAAAASDEHAVHC